MTYERKKDCYTVSTDKSRLDFDVVYGFVTNSYWARGTPKELMERAIANSLCFGLYEDGKQIGFARAATDYARAAYLMDVFVLEAYRGRGLGKWLMECVMEHLTSFGLRKILLHSSSAQGLYRKLGFTEVSKPQECMEIYYEMPWFKKE